MAGIKQTELEKILFLMKNIPEETFFEKKLGVFLFCTAKWSPGKILSLQDFIAFEVLKLGHKVTMMVTFTLTPT